MAGCHSGALAIKPSTIVAASMPATRMAMASVKSTSTRWKESGLCCAPGCGHTVASRRRSCLTILPCLSSCTTPNAEAKPCSALSWPLSCRPPQNTNRALEEIRQIWRPFFSIDLDTHHRQEGQGQHGQGDVPVPAMPTPDLAVIEADFLLGGFETFFNAPALTGNQGQGLQAGVGGTDHDIVRQLFRFGDLPTHQQPLVPRLLLLAEQPPARPIVPPLAFAAGPGAQTLPAVRRLRRRQILDRNLPRLLVGKLRPQRFGAPDREHIRPLLLLQPQPQSAVIAVDLVAGHPGERNPRGDRALDHELGQLRLGHERPLRRHADRVTALPIVGPGLGQVEFPVDQSVTLAAAIAQEHPDLAIPNPPRRAGVLAGDTDRFGLM